jgi:hypothetical protein
VVITAFLALVISQLPEPRLATSNPRLVRVTVTHQIDSTIGKTIRITNTLPEATSWSRGPEEIRWDPAGGKVVALEQTPKSYQIEPVPIRQLIWENEPNSPLPSSVTCSYRIRVADRTLLPGSLEKLTIAELGTHTLKMAPEMKAVGETIPLDIAALAKTQIQKDPRVISFVRAANQYCASKIGRGVEDLRGKPLDRYDITSVFALKKAWCGPLSSTFRAFCISVGIPAREASGYALKPIPFYNGEINMSDKRGVPNPRKDANAHVWAEIFLPKVGWVEVNVGSQGDCFSVPHTFVRVSGKEAPFVQFFDEKGRQTKFDPFLPHISAQWE